MSIITLSAVMLRVCPPDVSASYPQCPFHQWTGLLCPGCGATRALAALARGHFVEALHWNALVIAALPFALVLAANAYVKAMRGQRAWPPVPPVLIAVAFASSLAFAVLRNLP